MSEENASAAKTVAARTTGFRQRLIWGQFLIGLAAIIISGAALWTSFVQADATLKMQEASVLPAVQLDFLVEAVEGDLLSVVQLENVGVGPAYIKRWALLVNGAPMNEESLFAALPEAVAARDYAYSSMQNRILAPGASFTAAQFSGAAASTAVPALLQTLRAGETRIAMELCYCSVFDRCWTAIQIVGADNRRPVEDPRCEVRADEPAAPSEAPA